MATSLTKVESKQRSRLAPNAFAAEPRIPLSIFWAAVGVTSISSIYLINSDSYVSIIAAYLIAFSALLPTYLWVSGKALGIPIYPVFAITYIWTYALPLVIDHPDVM